MATFKASFLSTAVLFASVVTANANGFLKAQAGASTVEQRVVEETVAELASRHHAPQLRSIENNLRAMYIALPKNVEGKLHPATVRYALHRYFVQKHGWYLKGLEATAGGWSSSAPGSIMKDRAPVYIQSLMEKQLHSKGMGLHDLAVFAATMTDLVHQEASGLLHGFFAAMKLPLAGPVAREKTEVAVKAFLMSHLLLGSEMFDLSEEEVDLLEPDIIDVYPAWGGTYMWVQDLRLTRDLELSSRQNPFVVKGDSFTETAAFVQHLEHEFGAYQNLECRGLKSELVEREFQGSGRVPLSRFYTGGEDGEWKFFESVEYLRNLGALDETDPRRPSIMIANYITSQTNCLKSSGFYSVCCMNECEGLLGHVEMSIEAPSASSSRIVEVVAALHSDTVDAPRNLSAALVSRLDDIAAVHGGEVPLYGRLFAQWMHHAYPRECPFPHLSKNPTPMSPEEWMALKGEDGLDATEEEMRMHQESNESLPEVGVELKTEALPWDNEEEFLIGEQRASQGWLASLRPHVALLLLGAFAMSLRALPDTCCTPSQSKKAETKCMV